jgi:hypothetical protein
MNRADYNTYRGWTLPADEDGSDEGYLVEYTDGGKGNDSRHAGYISWSPKEQFDAAYRSIDVLTGMSFGQALVAMELGRKVARAGWNGKGMWLILVPGTPNINPTPGSAYAKAGIEACDILPHIDMWTTNAEGRRAMLPGWLASQTDMLAKDWSIV